MPDFVSDSVNGAEFEASVRHVAHQLYRHASYTGPVLIDDRERDDVIDTGTELIVVEATQSRRLEKTKGDLKKSIELIKKLRTSMGFSEYNFRVMLVVDGEPSADQIAYVRSSKAGCPTEIISFASLFSRLFDARHYIRVRGDQSFGSVRNPVDETDYRVPPSDYIATALSQEGAGESIKASELAMRLVNGGKYVIYGDYGSGKSMTLRDVYFRSRDQFTSGATLRCPVYLNLREHIAQTQPDEAPYRHAEKVGFPEPHRLISAWRAGFVTLFLDGFDELTPPQFALSINNLRQARRFAVDLIKKFMEQTPRGTPIITAGRDSYFDSRDEARIALGYGNSTQVFDLAGFTDQDIQRFLNANGRELPAWLPTRPLLLGYLANAGLLKEQDQQKSLSPAVGWDRILHLVCEREVNQIWGVGFEAIDLRLFIEGLATHARKLVHSRGLEDTDLRNVFHQVFGRDTDEPARLLTGRLPGLGSVPGRPGAREFIDADFADAAASGDLKRFIEAPFSASVALEGVKIVLGQLGREMAVACVTDIPAKTSIALNQSGQHAALEVTSADLMSILLDHHANYSGDSLNITGVNFDAITIDPDLDFSAITISQCIIGTLDIGASSSAQLEFKYPKFSDCVIGRVEGALSAQDVPAGVLIGSTSIEIYSAFAATNDAVLKSTLSDTVKVLLTVLRKLFMQRGTGRQYSALRRGLPSGLLKYVDPIVVQIKAEQFAEDIHVDRRTILVPYRSRSADALSIINGPNVSEHPLIKSVRNM